MRTFATVLFACAVVTVLASCNTVQGFGRDLQSGGEALTTKAEDAQRGS